MPEIDDKIILSLYVAGATLRSERAIVNIHRILADFLKDECEINIVDVIEDPEAAEMAKVMATPTLIREQPLPERRIIGDLTSTNEVLRALNIQGKKNKGN